MGLVLASGCLSLLALRVLKQGKENFAAYTTLGAVLVFSALIKLFWGGTTWLHAFGILLVGSSLAQLMLLNGKRYWAGAFSLLFAGLPIILDMIALPWRRFDVSQLVVGNAAFYVLVGSSAILIIWRIVIAYRSIQTIGLRLGLLFASSGILVALIMGSASVAVSVVTNRNQVLDQLSSIADVKETLLRSWIHDMQLDLDNLFFDNDVRDRVIVLFAAGISPNTRYPIERVVGQRFNSIIQRTQRYTEIFLVNQQGDVVFSTDARMLGINFGQTAFLRNGLLGRYVDQPRFDPNLGEISMVISRPVIEEDGKVVGIIGARVNLAQLDRIITGGEIGATGVSYVVAEDSTLLNTLGETRVGDSMVSDAISQAMEHDQFSGSFLDYRGVNVYGDYRWVPSVRAVLVTEVERREVLLNSLPLFLVSGAVAILTAFIGVLFSLWVFRGLSRRLSAMASVAGRISQGERDLVIDITGDDEISALGVAINSMTRQVSASLLEMEHRVEERTRGLRAVADVSRATTSELDPDKLMPQVVNLVYEQFQLYYVGLFVVEQTEQGQFAVLRAGTGEAGKKMLAQGWRLEVGGASMIGQSVSTGLFRVKQTEKDTTPRFENTLLPDTRSELALPLRYGPRVIGAMTVQSTREAAFDETTITLLQNMA
ncbi:MAG: GAF domain-containing protein, partial [Anaerolineae bacterium]|nr:GAF domain-containing protein [Anaerolineae bacterium]